MMIFTKKKKSLMTLDETYVQTAIFWVVWREIDLTLSELPLRLMKRGNKDANINCLTFLERIMVEVPTVEENTFSYNQ